MIIALAEPFRQAVRDELAPERYPFTTTSELMRQTKCNADETLRRRVLRCRNRIERLATNAGDSPPSLDGVSISGGETAQLKDIIRGDKPRLGFDLVGTAIGAVNLSKILVGQDIKAGDAVIGIASNGIHSNGLSLARKVFFEDRKFSVEKQFAELGNSSIGEELLEPTFIYVREALALMENGLAVKALIHITSDGFLNLSRVEAEVSFVIDSLPEIPPIFSLIEQLGGVDRTEMFSVYNMGVGFCVIVSPNDADRALSIIASFGKKACVMGYATEEQPRTVRIPNEGLLGKGKKFCRV